MQIHKYVGVSFRFSNELVTIIVKKHKSKEHGFQERIRGFTDYEKEPPTFCLQLMISYTKKRRLPQLEWQKYSVNIIFYQVIFNLQLNSSYIRYSLSLSLMNRLFNGKINMKSFVQISN